MTNLSLESIALVTGMAAFCFLAGLILFWKMPDSPARHWLLLFGIALLPGLALLFGSRAAIEKAKSPEFCGSCHVMDPFITDLKDPKSQTLASRHYQNRYILENQCYTCHTDYTVFGPVKAKLTGLRHLWNYETRNYRIPIKHRGPYNFENCLHCHGQAKIFLEKHDADVRKQLESKAVTCLDCHAPVHPEQKSAGKK
ncbi:MAG TPA: NapC/NirT family cytochrome c [Acidobacteriota bacterium]|nr:NapC/NirT family cytochrome c [Acidobacteriota bacterium]